MWDKQVSEDACGFVYSSLMLQKGDGFAACLGSMLDLKSLERLFFLIFIVPALRQKM